MSIPYTYQECDLRQIRSDWLLLLLYLRDFKMYETQKNNLENQRKKLLEQLSSEGHKLTTVHALVRINAMLESIDTPISDKRYSHHFRAFI